MIARPGDAVTGRRMTLTKPRGPRSEVSPSCSANHGHGLGFARVFSEGSKSHFLLVGKAPAEEVLCMALQPGSLTAAPSHRGQGHAAAASLCPINLPADTGHGPRSLEMGQWLGRCPRSFLLQAADNGCPASPARGSRARFCSFCWGYHQLQASRASHPSTQSSAALRAGWKRPSLSTGGKRCGTHLDWPCRLWYTVRCLLPGMSMVGMAQDKGSVAVLQGKGRVAPLGCASCASCAVQPEQGLVPTAPVPAAEPPPRPLQSPAELGPCCRCSWRCSPRLSSLEALLRDPAARTAVHSISCHFFPLLHRRPLCPCPAERCWIHPPTLRVLQEWGNSSP